MNGKPRSTLQKLIDGERNKDRINLREPVASGTIPDAPDWMTDRQKEIWATALECAPAGVLKTIDAGVFTTWVVARSLHEASTEEINRDGMQIVVRTPRTETIKAHPLHSAIARHAETMTRAATQLGFTPVARSRIQGETAASSESELLSMLKN